MSLSYQSPRRCLNGRAFSAQRQDTQALLPPPFLPAASELATRRANLAQSLAPGSMAVIPAAEQAIMSQNIPYRFRQNSDLRYFTGFPEAGALLLLTRSLSDELNSTLFVQVCAVCHCPLLASIPRSVYLSVDRCGKQTVVLVGMLAV